MYNSPFAVFSYPYGNGVHDSSAVRFAVTGFYINVKAAKAVRAMVAVVAAGALRNNFTSADLAGKNLFTGVGFVIALFKFFLFIFTVHNVPPDESK